jgi:hypothetical protein
MERIAFGRIERSPIEMELRIQTTDDLAVRGREFDRVVNTWTLCSLRDFNRAVMDVSRVLNPAVD